MVCATQVYYCFKMVTKDQDRKDFNMEIERGIDKASDGMAM